MYKEFLEINAHGVFVVDLMTILSQLAVLGAQTR